MPLQGDVGGLECKGGVLLEGVIDPGVALGIEVGAGLNSHFVEFVVKFPTSVAHLTPCWTC